MPLTTESARRRIPAETFLALCIIGLVSTVFYYGSFSGAFVFDDDTAIVRNQTIRHLRPLWNALNPPVTTGGITVVGRPLLNLSFAVNYAISGMRPWSYHCANLIIHLLAAFLLFAIIRRTLLSAPDLRGRFGGAAWSVALAAALLWALHPLQTESVTYVSQRAESLAGMLYLLTLYCFMRGTASTVPLIWYAGSFTACLLGSGCKEVIASAPLMTLLYDRTFISSSFKEALKRRWPVFLSLAATWFPLALLIAGAHGPRAGAAGFELVSPLAYAMTQCKAIVLYLKLTFWPHPLVIDYGEKVAGGIRDILWQGPAVLLLAAGTVIALRRRPVLGFLGAWFFLIIAPSSSFVPVATQTMAEHRMYLPVAAVIVPAVAGLYAVLGRRFWLAVVPLALAAGWITMQRNADYRSELSLWSTTAAQCPSNPRVRHNLGYALWVNGRTEEAVREFRTALAILPNYPRAHSNLGWILYNAGRQDEAIGHYREALRLKPDLADAHMNLGIALFQLDKKNEAMEHLEEAVRLRPDVKALGNLGFACALSGRFAEAAARFREVLRLDPDNLLAGKDLEAALDSLRSREGNERGDKKNPADLRPRDPGNFRP